MRATHLNPSTYRQMPWKNGLGVTTEIARAPLEGEFAWRISVARVTSDGPFSTFPGCDRIILALEGAGMILAQPGTATEVTLGLLEPWTFSGDATTTCVLRGGPIRDFNVIARRASFTPALSVLRPAAEETLDDGAETTILYCATGALAVEAAGTFELAPEETLVIQRASGDRERVAIRASAPRTVVIHVTLSGRSSSARVNSPVTVSPFSLRLLRVFAELGKDRTCTRSSSRQAAIRRSAAWCSMPSTN